MKTTTLTSLIFLLGTSVVVAAPDSHDERGLLPEVRLNSKDENENERRALQNEILITRAETKAIESLQAIIKRKKGSPDEADLLHRLAEMYTRRARTGRFLDLNKDSKTVQLSSFPLRNEKGSDWLKKTLATYADIEKRFPKYREMDSVLFNSAFAHQQLNHLRESEVYYNKVVEKFPQSRLVPDAAVALGELAYDQRRFALALNHFETAEKFTESRVYTYALYKSAWSHYNMKDSENGVQKLLAVVKACPPDMTGEDTKNRQNLRREALRDLVIFTGDTRSGSDLYALFKKITTEDELGQAMLDLAKLSLSHSRFKEITAFLGEFLGRHPDNSARVRLNMTLVDAHEALKQRPKVIEGLADAAKACHPESSWRTKQTADVIKDSCTLAFQHKSLEIAGKWWEIWKKNQKNAEFSGLTEQALKLVLDNEDPKDPDLNSRFAYAELLFQLNRLNEAADNYHIVGEKETKDVKRRHDADYGALFSTEKDLEKGKTPLKEARRKDFAQTYLKRHPQGDHSGEVTFKMAFIHYEEADYEGSQKWLDPLLAGRQGRELQKKAEDLQLDILNLRKDYKNLAIKAKTYRGNEDDGKRQAALDKILVESSYADLQNQLKEAPKDQAIEKLRTFSQTHKSSSLATDALWQGAALAFVEGKGLEASSLIEEFASRSPNDSRLPAALKESARSRSEAGDMEGAARLLRLLATKEPAKKVQHLEAAADFLLLESNLRESRQIYNDLLISAPNGDRSRLYTKLIETYKNEPQSPEIKRLQNLVLSQNMEPFATQILTTRAKDLLENGKRSEAFEAARKIMSRDASAEARTEARLIQARILEGEFTSQSVKSSREDRFAMVLAMKTEKLEKAQTAYLSASKMTTDSKLLAEAFSGIDRCYAHYIDSLEHSEPPATLSEADKVALKTEISKILGPLREKRDENRQQIRKIASVGSAGTTKGTNWADLNADASPLPAAQPPVEKFRPYLAREWAAESEKLKRYEASKKEVCDAKKPLFGPCFLGNQLDVAEKIAQAHTQAKESRVQGWYELSLIAEHRNQKGKALWLLGLAEKEDAGHPLVNYEKGRLLFAIDGLSASLSDFGDVLNTSMSSTEIAILRGVRAFSEGDFKTVTSLFSGMKKEELYNLNLGLLLSESYAALGDIDKALKLINELSTVAKNPEMYIQQGRLFESYKFAPVPALESYDKALQMAKDPGQKEWLNRKKEYLKVNFKVGLNVDSGG